MLPALDVDSEFKKAKKKEEEIRQFIAKRRENESKGISNASIDAKLKFKLDDFINSINTIKLKQGSNTDLNSSNKSKQNSNNFYIDELFQIYKNFKKEFDELKISINNSIENTAYKSRSEDDYDKPINTRQEYETIKENKLKEGDEIFDELRGQAKMIKTGAVMINDHLKMQEPLLDKLNNNFDKIEGKMKRTENKLANYLNKSSSSCLYYVILAEFVLLILFFAI